MHMSRLLARIACLVPLCGPAAANGTALQDVKINVREYCGSWRVLAGEGVEPAVPGTACLSAPSTPPEGYFLGSCSVGLAAGRYQLELKGQRNAPLSFEVDKKGAVSVLEPNDGVIADGGGNEISLRLMKVTVDANGFGGPYGFEYVGGAGSPISGCDGERRLMIPVGSRYMFGPGGGIVVTDRNRWIYSESPDTVEAVHNDKASLRIRTARVLIYPDPATSAHPELPWVVFEAEEGNSLAGGSRTVTLPVNQELHIKTQTDDAVQSAPFIVSKDCKVTPGTVVHDGMTFRLFSLC